MTKKKRQAYRLRNWTDYNKALIRRGSLTLWVGEDVLAAWHEQERTGRRGCPRTYSAATILAMATLAEVYGLPLRATRGLLLSVFELLGLSLPVPCYTTLSRRRQSLAVRLPRRRKSEPLHLVVDSTGVKTYGEGEWKRESGYHRRSLDNAAVFRLKMIFGERASECVLLRRAGAATAGAMRGAEPDDAPRDAGQLQGRGIRSVQLESQLRSSSFMQQSPW